MSSDRDALLAIGHQCSAEYCHLVDFLPFKCQHCEHKFCGEHYLPAAHKCGKYDESKHNRIAPSCPLCNTPVAIPPGQDPNMRMDKHINSECSVMTGKSKSSSRPHCANARCNKVLIAPIPCDTCKQQFCAQHRFPADHKCLTSTKPAANMPTSTFTGNLTSARSAAAMAAIKRSMASKLPTPTATAKPPAPQPSPVASSSASSSNPTKHNPFSKTDRRAKAERESRLKAMEARAKKGLLSEDEKAILVAERAKGDEKDDCVLM